MANIDHESFIQPQDKNVPLWRYVDLAKFIWMLQNRAVYFSRLDLLGDPYEAHYTKQDKLSVPGRVAQIVGSGLNPAGRSLDLDKAQIMNVLEMTFERVVKTKKEFFVSCWHMNERESAAMWKLYTSLSESVCIKTTYARLASALPEDVLLGVVKYIDYDKDVIKIGNVYNYPMHKRESFRHEREARAIIWQNEHTVALHPERRLGDVALKLDIDLDKTIKAVYVSPNSHPMMREIVQRLLKDFGLDRTVLQSDVNSPPAY